MIKYFYQGSSTSQCSSYIIWVECLHLLQFLCSKLKRSKRTVGSQMAIRHVQRDVTECLKLGCTYIGIWIDATGINWSSCHESQHPLWAQKDKEGLTDSETYTTSSLSIPTDPRTSAGLLHVFVKLWNKKQHNTWHKFHSFWYCHYTWKVTVSVALHISQSLHLCIVCIEENIEFLWFIAITRCWFLIIVNEEIFCL